MPTEWNQLGGNIVGDTDDFSGYSVSSSSDGTIVAIGAPVGGAGRVRVYQFTADTNESNGGTWNQLGGDIVSGFSDKSGWSVSLSSDGKIVAIGAPLNGNNDDAGQVLVYKWDGSSWNQLGYAIDGLAAFDNSGWSVSLNSDGTIVAIGAPGNNNVNGNDSGQVRVYKFTADTNESNGGTWIQVGGDIDGDAAGDNSGWSVSLSRSGNIVAIGAIGNDDGGSDSGQVRVYHFTANTSQPDGGTWIQLGGDIDGEAASDQNGTSVSLNSDGTIVAIGAPGNNNVNGNDAGQVRIYKWDDSSWNQLGGDIDGEGSDVDSGYSVSLNSDGDIVAIGAPDINLDGTITGQVRVYKWDGSLWNQIGEPIGSILYDYNNDYNGFSVSLNSEGNIVAIGAPKYSNDKGEVRVYKLNVEEIELEVVVESDNLTKNAAGALARIQLEIQEGVDVTKGKLLLQILGNILKKKVDIKIKPFIIRMITSLNEMLNDM